MPSDCAILTLRCVLHCAGFITVQSAWNLPVACLYSPTHHLHYPHLLCAVERGLGRQHFVLGVRTSGELGRMAGSFSSDASTSLARPSRFCPTASLSSTVAGNACDSSPDFALNAYFRHSFVDLEAPLLVIRSVVAAPVDRTAESGRVSTQHSRHQTLFSLHQL